VLYLIRSKGKVKTAHIWEGKDTACRMWSTGGMSHKRAYELYDAPYGLSVCTMCANVHGNATREDPPDLVRLVKDIGLSDKDRV
jgi:hypothetical protein